MYRAGIASSFTCCQGVAAQREFAGSEHKATHIDMTVCIYAVTVAVVDHTAIMSSQNFITITYNILQYLGIVLYVISKREEIITCQQRRAVSPA